MKNKKAAMEMSVGTIVTIVLLMSVLVLGIFLVQKVFKSGTNAIDTIDSEVQNQISQLFSEEGKSLAVYPTSREIVLKKGNDPRGFAFSVKNNNMEMASYEFTVSASDVSNCGGYVTEQIANSYLLGGSGSFSLGPGNSLELPRLVKFSIPESAVPCTIVYQINIDETLQSGIPDVLGTDIFVTIK